MGVAVLILEQYRPHARMQKALTLLALLGQALGQFVCPPVGFGMYCTDCNTFVVCDSGSQNSVACTSGTSCGYQNGYGTCMADGTDITSACSCPTTGGFIADPFDTAKYYICLPDGSKVELNCDTGLVFDATSNTCVTSVTSAPASCTTEGELTMIDCSTFTVCVGGSLLTQTCEDGTVVDMTSGACVAPETLTPETFTCDGKATGLYADTVDCSLFWLCVDGVVSGPAISCGTQNFDETTGTCTNESSQCPVVSPCAAPCRRNLEYYGTSATWRGLRTGI